MLAALRAWRSALGAPRLALRAWRSALLSRVETIRRGDAGAGGQLLPLGEQTLLQGGEDQQHAVGAGVVPHQADAPDLALVLAQAAADLDAEVREQLLAHRQVFHAGRHLDGVELRQLASLDGEILQPQRLQTCLERLVMAPVPGPTRLQALF